MNETNERYYDYMIRRSREEDAKMAKENAMNKAERSIWVTFNKEGVHMYPGADTDPKLATGDWDDVSFLGISHLRSFHMTYNLILEPTLDRWLYRFRYRVFPSTV